MAFVETGGEVSGALDHGINQASDNGDEPEIPHSVNPDDQGWDFSQKSWREDLELVVEGRTLHVASNILSLLSPVFTVMFEERFQGDRPRRIELPGKKHGDLVQFLRCLYPNAYQEITEDNVFKVLPLADEFKVKELKKLCEEFLVQTCSSPLSDERVCEYLQLVSRYDLVALRAKCIKLLALIDPEVLSEAEKKNPISPDLKSEVQNRQNRKLFKAVSKLRKQNESYSVLMKEILLYNLAIGENMEKFRQAQEGTIKLTIQNISTFQSIRSRRETIHEVRWHCLAQKTLDYKGKGDQLGVFLCSDIPDHWDDMKCDVLCEFWLLNKETGKHLIHKMTHTFTLALDSLGFNEFISMKDLASDGKYLVDGAAQVNIYFLVNKPSWTPMPDEYSDTTDDDDDDDEERD